MGKVSRKGKQCKRCCVNLKRGLKKAFTCGGKLPRCCRRMRRKCRKVFCFSPCCTWCNVCESCRKCRRWARRCVCKPRRGPRRVAHVEYYKVKKRRSKRRIGETEQASEDHSRVFCIAVSTHSKLNAAVRDKDTKDSAGSKSNHEVTSKSVIKDGVDEGTSASV